MRLTEKRNNSFEYYRIKPDVGEDAIAQKWNYYDAVDKLGKLEDIEDKLGVDLILYLKMCVIGTNVCVKYQGEVLEMAVVHKLVYNPDLKAFGFFAGDFIPRFPMSEYGRTWALTKEELNK